MKCSCVTYDFEKEGISEMIAMLYGIVIAVTMNMDNDAGDDEFVVTFAETNRGNVKVIIDGMRV